jgi:hypothetical protein
MNFKDRDEEIAFKHWEKPKPTARADRALSRFENVSLKMAREGLLLSPSEVAKRLDLTPAGYRQLELRAN